MLHTQKGPLCKTAPHPYARLLDAVARNNTAASQLSSVPSRQAQRWDEKCLLNLVLSVLKNFTRPYPRACQFFPFRTQQLNPKP